MSVCAARSDTPGFFTSCTVACGGLCVCGEAVRAETEPAVPTVWEGDGA